MQNYGTAQKFISGEDSGLNDPRDRRSQQNNSAFGRSRGSQGAGSRGSRSGLAAAGGAVVNNTNV